MEKSLASMFIVIHNEVLSGCDWYFIHLIFFREWSIMEYRYIDEIVGGCFIMYFSPEFPCQVFLFYEFAISNVDANVLIYNSDQGCWGNFNRNKRVTFIENVDEIRE
jgi:hypothetical protein